MNKIVQTIPVKYPLQPPPPLPILVFSIGLGSKLSWKVLEKAVMYLQVIYNN